jgi:hypothetical protein
MTKPFPIGQLVDLITRTTDLRFDTAPAPPPPPLPTTPTLEAMDGRWREAFHQALTQGDISRLRSLATEARGKDPALSEELLRLIGNYQLNELHQIEARHGS